MCSSTACIHNKACKAIYERIVAKGKRKKLALIAVGNKLLKQAFAIAKSGLTYDENFVSKKSVWSFVVFDFQPAFHKYLVGRSYLKSHFILLKNVVLNISKYVFLIS